MPEFSYNAIDRNSHHASGTMEAASVGALELELRSAGYCLTEAKELHKEKKNARRARVSRRELADFYYGISSLLEAGLPVLDTFRALGEEANNPTLSRVIEDIEVHVQTGNQISVALENYPAIFSLEMCNIVAAGERSGNLPEAFSELAKHTEWVERVMADVKQASVYPIMILCAVSALIGLLFVLVIPKFAEIFLELDMQLPLITRLVMGVGDAAQQYWWTVTLVIAGSWGATRLGVHKTPEISDFIDRAKLRVPVFGPLQKMIEQSRLTHNLGLLLRAGIPILDALELCRGLVGNSVMRRAVEAAEIAVGEGRRASDALREYDVISPLTIRMFVLGEETGNLDECLQHVNKRFDEEIPRKVKRVFSILEPLITIVLVVVVGVVAASLFIPMMSLIGGIGRA